MRRAMTVVMTVTDSDAKSAKSSDLNHNIPIRSFIDCSHPQGWD